MSEIEAEREANRAAFPSVTKIVDQFRAVFGSGVKVLGGRDFITGKEFGWNPPPSPNCDACTGNGDERGCSRMDRVVFKREAPDPARVICGYRLRVDATPVVTTGRRK